MPGREHCGAEVDSPPIRRLLVRAPNWLGDVVLSLAAVRDLRRNFPDARIEVLARSWVAGLYGAVAEVDGIRTSHGFLANVRSIRGVFDAVVLLPNSIRSALQAFVARIPERWGYATDGRRALLTRAVRVPAEVRGESQVYYYRAMLGGLGLEVSASADVSIRCPDAWAAYGARTLAEPGPWVGLNPGAAYGTAKRWLPARYAAVGDLLGRRLGARVAILGGAAEEPLGRAIAAAMRSRARVLCGDTTIPELVGVMSSLSLLVTNDSGPMHVAAALGVPLVAIFGPTDWEETAPRALRQRLVRQPVECAPCLLRECPIDHRCMTGVTVDRVVEEAQVLLAGGHA